MKQIYFPILLVLCFVSGSVFSAEQELTADEQAYLTWAKGLWDSMDRKQGEVTLLDGVATLNVPEGFYYLNPTDTKTVLVDVWGNPPESSASTLGMLFPAESTPFDQGSWGVIIEYEEDGFVSDEEADEIDYQELLAQMKQSTREASKQRVDHGYEPIELVGWASEPFYDKDSHKLHWAKEVKFGSEPENTLNYNIRVLGRKGVLVLNFVAGMDQKPVIDQKIDSVLAMADFDQGSRYEDFNPDIDKVAAYGIGALVAGKVAAKTGLLAAAFLFLKKFGILIFAGAAAMFGKLFKRKKENPVA
ncbi:MAG: DUF2167 domain-containing protein [Gammaproteobacteria bacterium]|jgi:uncharacterized membrane-anchored protein